jgi:hypothetical protein
MNGNKSVTASFVTAPGAFAKSSPLDGATVWPWSPTLSWSGSAGATVYDYCIDTVNNGQCDTAWISAGSSTHTMPAGLIRSTSYYWQVRARNVAGTLYANSGLWWRLMTASYQLWFMPVIRLSQP